MTGSVKLGVGCSGHLELLSQPADRRMQCQSIVWTLTFGILEAGWHSAGYQGYDPFTVFSCVFARLLVKDVLSERISP